MLAASWEKSCEIAYFRPIYTALKTPAPGTSQLAPRTGRLFSPLPKRNSTLPFRHRRDYDGL